MGELVVFDYCQGSTAGHSGALVALSDGSCSARSVFVACTG